MRYRIMCFAAASAALGGCVLGNPHNDVLVFGTTTKVALDVSAPVQNGALPEFTLGYKRNEGVWMPLKANSGFDGALLQDPLYKSAFEACLKRRQDERVAHGQQPVGPRGSPTPTTDPALDRRVCAAEVLPADKYLAHARGIDSSKGGKEDETDTYSVFASFGGRGGLGFNNSSGQLAQFFATGIAAQRLGANPGLAEALNAGADEAGAAKAASDAAAKVAKANADAAVAAAAIRASVQAPIDYRNKELADLATEWDDCADPEKDSDKFQAVIAEASKQRPFLVFVGIQANKTDALLAFKSGQTDDIKEFRRVRAEACKGT